MSGNSPEHTTISKYLKHFDRVMAASKDSSSRWRQSSQEMNETACKQLSFSEGNDLTMDTTITEFDGQLTSSSKKRKTECSSGQLLKRHRDSVTGLGNEKYNVV